ncbi:MAG TPA: hypothetical protein PLV92_06550 [Pirellulaceae bacterium]|nr:hypothetical protein [Pirellulaceae bacterium]
MVEIRFTDDALWERIERAVEKVKDRLRRVTQALESALIPYAVVGGNAVQIWVAQVDESVARNTQDVDIVLRRVDLAAAIRVLGAAGFIFREAAGITMFLDGPQAKARDAVYVVFAGEKVRPEYVDVVPEITEYEWIRNVRLMPLEALVRMKLTSFRDKDRVHLRDMLSVGLIDASWLADLPIPLAERLRELIDNPE